jgi:hypothetical protein
MTFIGMEFRECNLGWHKAGDAASPIEPGFAEFAVAESQSDSVALPQGQSRGKFRDAYCFRAKTSIRSAWPLTSWKPQLSK